MSVLDAQRQGREDGARPSRRGRTISWLTSGRRGMAGPDGAGEYRRMGNSWGGRRSPPPEVACWLVGLVDQVRQHLIRFEAGLIGSAAPAARVGVIVVQVLDGVVFRVERPI